MRKGKKNFELHKTEKNFMQTIGQAVNWPAFDKNIKK